MRTAGRRRRGWMRGRILSGVDAPTQLGCCSSGFVCLNLVVVVMVERGLCSFGGARCILRRLWVVGGRVAGGQSTKEAAFFNCSSWYHLFLFSRRRPAVFILLAGVWLGLPILEHAWEGSHHCYKAILRGELHLGVDIRGDGFGRSGGRTR